jgi:hypothetical protein
MSITVDYCQKEIAASSRETDFEKPDCEITQYKANVQKLKALLHFIETEKQTTLPPPIPIPEEFLEYKDIDLTVHERSLWGNNVGMGVPFVRPRNLPFSFFMKYTSSKARYPLAFSTHPFDIGNSRIMGNVRDYCLPFQLMTEEMATLCGPQNYAGYCDGWPLSFMLISRPILTVVVKTISKRLVELLLEVELASEFMTEKFDTENIIVHIDQDARRWRNILGIRAVEKNILYVDNIDRSSAEVIPLQEFINRLS